MFPGPKTLHHRNFQTAPSPVIIIDALEDLVESLRHEGPEVVYRGQSQEFGQVYATVSQ